MKRRLRGIDWHLEMAVGVVGDGVLLLLRHGFPTLCSPPSFGASQWLRS